MPKFDAAKHVIRLQGKEYILFPGLLAAAHDTGCFAGVEVRKLQDPNEDNSYRVIFEATVSMLVRDSGGNFVAGPGGGPFLATYTAQGDASPKDVSRNLVPSLLRMGETRAVARALRFATASEYTALEELPTTEISEQTDDGRPS